MKKFPLTMAMLGVVGMAMTFSAGAVLDDPVCSGLSELLKVSTSRVRADEGLDVAYPESGRTRMIERSREYLDTNGRMESLGSTLGTVTLVSFFYADCSTQRKCPAVVQSFQELRDEFMHRGLLGKVQLRLITLDARNDSPNRLKRFAVDRGLKLDNNFRILVPKTGDAPEVYREFGVPVSLNASGVTMHGIHMAVLDSRLRLAHSFSTVLWKKSRVVEVVEALVREAEADATVEAGRLKELDSGVGTKALSLLKE